MTTPLQELAVQTAKALRERIGVDGAIVILVRKGDDSFGVSFEGPEIPVDTMVAAGVEAMAVIRRNVINAAAALVEQGSSGDVDR